SADQPVDLRKSAARPRDRLTCWRGIFRGDAARGPDLAVDVSPAVLTGAPMYLAAFGLTEAPFSTTADQRFLYLSDRHRDALAHLAYGVAERGGFVQLTGEVGTGKTTVCRYLLEHLPDDVDVALVLNPTVTRLELLATICDEL